MISTLRQFFLISLFLAFSLSGKGNDGLPENLSLSGLKFRSIGPAVFSGRITDFAVNPAKKSEYYAAVASGGVWKTENAGISWEPIFDGQGSYSIGCVAINPFNPHEIWIGTGENNSQRSVSYGDGIYRSRDDGKSWKNMGLKKSEHIAKIIFDPQNRGIIYVAAQGPLWGPGGDRGLYKSVDGGDSWKKVLNISKDTGVTDVVIDPRNPDVLYAASYQRRRHVWVLLDGGPESAIYKSTDGAKSWDKLSKGLPGDDIGRIGLAISPVNPDIIYAIIEAQYDGSGTYMSVNRGESWIKRNKYIATSPQYYMEIVADPKDAGKLYSLDTWTMVSRDSARTWKRLGNDNRHVDDHALWIDPNQTGHLLIGGDGGIYESYDEGRKWDFKENLPITQFYRVAVDSAYPFYNVYGGTQDNSSLGGPSRTINKSGISNIDWYVTNGGDGFQSQVDPTNPNIVYAQSQYGWLVRYDRKNRESMGIKPVGEWGETLKWNWDSPLLISPHNPKRLFFGANRLFQSDDLGNTWRAISPDLTRQIDRNKLKVMGKIWSVDAVAKNNSTSFYGTLVALSESPLQEGLIYTGSDDGLLQISENSGKNWEKLKFPGKIPNNIYISDITASRHNVNVVYVTLDNHKMADFKPYILKSDDRGRSWDLLTAGLPANGPAYTITEDNLEKNLLFAGTEYGLYFSINGGNNWRQLKSGLPTIAIRDLAIQERESDLVLASFGRSFYILDDYSPLRHLAKKPEVLKSEGQIFPVKKALLFMETRWGPGAQGSNFYQAENPAFGATFTYFLRDTIRSLKDIRVGKEKKLAAQNKPVYYPDWGSLEKEDLQQKPFLMFVIKDQDGNIVRTLKKEANGGIDRVTWDLRYPAYRPPEKELAEEDQASTPAMPGKYQVSMYKNIDGEISLLAGPVQFTVESLGMGSLDTVDRNALVEFQQKVAKLNRAVKSSIASIAEIQKNIPKIRLAIKNSRNNTLDMMETLRKIEYKLSDISKGISGNSSISKRSEEIPVSINSRLDIIVEDQWRSTSAPTSTQLNSYKICAENFQPLLDELKQLLTKDLPEIEKQMDLSESPWTPGRVPQWK